VLVCSALYVVVIGALLWRAHEVRLSEASVVRFGALGRARAAMAGSCILAFTTAFVWSAVTMAADAP
jgi:hypothetical protein